MTNQHTRVALKARRRRLRGELKAAKSQALAHPDGALTHSPYRGYQDSAHDRVRRLEESLHRIDHDLAEIRDQRSPIRLRRERTPVEALATTPRVSRMQAQLLGTLTPASLTMLGHLCMPGKPQMWVGMAVFGAFLGSFISVFHNS